MNKFDLFKKAVNEIAKPLEAFGFKASEDREAFMKLEKIGTDNDLAYTIRFGPSRQFAPQFDHIEDLSIYLYWKIEHKNNEIYARKFPHKYDFTEEEFEITIKEITDFIQSEILPFVETVETLETIKDKNAVIEFLKNKTAQSTVNNENNSEKVKDVLNEFINEKEKTVEDIVNESIKKHGTCLLCYTDFENYPAALPVIPVKSDGIKEIVFVSNGKNILKSGSNVSIVFFDSRRGFDIPPLWGVPKGIKPESNTFREQHTPLLCGGVVDSFMLNYITLQGSIEIFTDKETKKEMRFEGCEKHFCKISNQNYCVIKFTTIKYCIHKEMQQVLFTRL